MKYLTFDPNDDILLLFCGRQQDWERPETNHGDGLGHHLGTKAPEPVTLKGSLRSRSPAAKGGQDYPVHMLVSSRHMILASKVFTKMLSPKFAEGITLISTGRIEQPLPEDDPIAFEILLHIIHGHTRRVPRVVQLPLLTRLAIMVDKYDLWEVVEMFSDAWISHLQDTLPKTYAIDLLPWLCVSWVFNKPSVFSHVSKLLPTESHGRIEEDLLKNLPIPQSIMEKIEASRLEAISQALSIIDIIIVDFLGSKVHCLADNGRGFDCDTMTLGALVKNSRRIGILPFPSSLYDGISFSDLICRIRQMEIPNHCEKMASYSKDWQNRKKSKDCDISIKKIYCYDFDDFSRRTTDKVPVLDEVKGSACVIVKETIEASIQSLIGTVHGVDLKTSKRKRRLCLTRLDNSKGE